MVNKHLMSDFAAHWRVSGWNWVQFGFSTAFSTPWSEQQCKQNPARHGRVETNDDTQIEVSFLERSQPGF